MSRTAKRIEVVITREDGKLVGRRVENPTGPYLFRGMEFPDLVEHFGVSQKEGRALISATNVDGGQYITTII